jgi:hypothetical protein
VQLFPGYMYQIDPDALEWISPVSAVVFRPTELDGIRNVFLEVTSNIAHRLGYDQEVAKERFEIFFRDLKRGKQLFLTWPGAERCVQIGPTSTGGIATGEIRIPNAAVTRSHPFARRGTTIHAERPNPSIPLKHDLDIASRFLAAIPYRGVSIISDIDDTIKITGVGSIKTLLTNSLLKSFKPVPHMAAVYRRWARWPVDVAFHYVSSSPWPMANLLYKWLQELQYPEGSIHLKAFRLEPFEPWGIDATVLNILKNPTAYKIARIEAILHHFPGRSFVLVGDSGEKDPEIYSEIARRNPAQIKCIYIRSMSFKPLDTIRHNRVTRGLEPWQVVPFTDPFAPPSLGRILSNLPDSC